MFENEDLNLEECWFAEHFPNEVNMLSAGTSRQNIQQPSMITSNSPELHSIKPAHSALKSPQKMFLKRKFPGPAGLFPEERNDSSKSNQDNHVLNSDSFILSTQYLCSQTLNLTFQEPTWIDMCKDFKEGSIKSSLLEKYNIEWIRNNIARNLINRKVPILGGIIKQIKSTSKSPIFVLADPTGELEALISPDLYEDLSEFLNVNSVLILKKFSILSINKYKHYLNITSDNLVRIYSCKDMTEDIQIVHIQKISNESLEQEIKNFINKYQEEEYDDGNFEENVNKAKVLNKPSLNNVTNKSCFKANQYSSRCTNNKSKSSPISKTINYHSLQMKQNSVSSNNRNSSGVILNTECQVQPKRFTERPSTSTSIFEQPNNFLDLDLNLDDFQEEFSPSETNNKEKSNAKHSASDCKKIKLCLDKCTAEPDVDPQNILNQLSSTSRSDDILEVNTKKQRNTLDCSQISILTQNNENPDIIKEIFSDLDAAALFDEDF